MLIQMNNIEGVNPLTSDSLVVIPERRVGNTTRVVNEIIEILFFNNQAVQIKDHYEDGKHKEANKRVWHAVLRRLQTEHKINIKKAFTINDGRVMQLKANRRDWY